MTIVHFVVSKKFGGVESHICTLIKLMKDEGYHFKIVCHQAIEEQFNERLQGLDVDIISFESWFKPIPFGYLTLIKTFKKLSPDVVQCHLYSATRVGAFAAKLAGVPAVIETIHTEEVWRIGFKKWLFNTIDAILGYLFVNKYIAVSRAVARYYKKNKRVPESKIVLIHNTTEDSEVEIHQNKKFSWRIGYLGRLSDEKGLDVLINSISILHDRNIPCKLYIGGSGPLREDLEHQAKKESIEDAVIFLGNITDKNTFFSKIDIFVLPSRFEGFSLVLLEAGFYQMPVVATNVSGNPEIILEKKTGLLVEKEDAAALATAIEEYQDENKRDQYSKNLKSLVETEFSTQKYIDRMKIFYKKLDK